MAEALRKGLTPPDSRDGRDYCVDETGLPNCDHIRGLLEHPYHGLFTLWGNGEPGIECGTMHEYLCNGCGLVHESEEHCDRRECPDCKKRLSRRRASYMRGRLLDGMHHYGTRGHHVVISPPGHIRVFNWDEYEALKYLCYKSLQEAGVIGGVLVCHPWRESKEHEFDRPGLHFHAFCIGDWIESGDSFYSRTGMVLKRIPSFQASMQVPYEYVLSHAAYIEGHNTATWFGGLAYNKMSQKAQEKAAREIPLRTCPNCGSADLTCLSMGHAGDNSFGDHRYYIPPEQRDYG